MDGIDEYEPLYGYQDLVYKIRELREWINECREGTGDGFTEVLKKMDELNILEL